VVFAVKNLARSSAARLSGLGKNHSFLGSGELWGAFYPLLLSTFHDETFSMKCKHSPEKQEII
jgi:hypothetical protein